VWGGDRVIASEGLDRLMRAVEGEAETFLTGRGIGTGFTQSEDMTILGPFGGPPPNVSGSNRRAKRVLEAAFRVWSVNIRRCEQNRGGRSRRAGLDRAEQRATQGSHRVPAVGPANHASFRLDDDGHWWRLHRHADPLIRYRPGDETFALARETSD